MADLFRLLLEDPSASVYIIIAAGFALAMVVGSAGQALASVRSKGIRDG